MTETTVRTLRTLLDTSIEDLSSQQVQELQAAARDAGALADTLRVTELKQVTPARLEAWQAEADRLLQASAQTPDEQE